MHAEQIQVPLPDDKAQLEKFFAERFVEQFNSESPLGSDVSISDVRQNETYDLDFSINCRIADYLELAELAPLNQEFGRASHRTGRLNIYTYARWIFFRVIKKKSRSYGIIARRTILLLYVTHWQFYPSERVVECLNSLVQHNGCDFAAVFVILTNGSDLRVLRPIHPYVGPPLRAPRAYEGFTLRNLEPGQFSWSIDR